MMSVAAQPVCTAWSGHHSRLYARGSGELERPRRSRAPDEWATGSISRVAKGDTTPRAVESAIFTSALILDRCGRMNGRDPSVYVQRAQRRREEVDGLMRRAVTSAWAHIPAEEARNEALTGLNDLLSGDD
jgi:hypothetical protein